MKNKVVFDTSFLSAAIVHSDIHHLAANEFLTHTTSTTEIFIPRTVLLELEQMPKSLKNPRHYEDIDEFLLTVRHKVIDINEDFLNKYRVVNRRISEIVRTIDLTVLAAALINNCDVLTFDKKLQNLANRYI